MPTRGFLPHGALSEGLWFLTASIFVAIWIYSYIRKKQPLWSRFVVAVLGYLLSTGCIVAAIILLNRLSDHI